MAIEEIKILGAVLSYQLDNTANPAHLPRYGPMGQLGLPDWQFSLAGSSKTVPQDFDAMGAKPSY